MLIDDVNLSQTIMLNSTDDVLYQLIIRNKYIIINLLHTVTYINYEVH